MRYRLEEMVMNWMLLILVFRMDHGALSSIEDRQIVLFQTEEQCVAAGEKLQASPPDYGANTFSVSTCLSKEDFDAQELATA
jgi:hypothetical protein